MTWTQLGALALFVLGAIALLTAPFWALSAWIVVWAIGLTVAGRYARRPPSSSPPSP